MSRLQEILDRNNTPYQLADALEPEARDALSAEMAHRAGMCERHQYFRVHVDYFEGKYVLRILIPSAATGARAHEESLAIVTQLAAARAGSFRPNGVDYTTRIRRGGEATHFFCADAIDDVIDAINQVLSPEIEKLDAAKIFPFREIARGGR